MAETPKFNDSMRAISRIGNRAWAMLSCPPVTKIADRMDDSG